MAQKDEELLAALLQMFYVEAAEHIQTLNQTLLKLERERDEKVQVELVRDAFRTAHSLKGAARAVSMESVERLANGMEDVLKQARDTGVKPDPNTCDVLYGALDVIQHILDGGTYDAEPLLIKLESLVQVNEVVTTNGHQTETVPALYNDVAETSMVAHATESDDTIRVAISKLDALMAQASELLGTKINAEQRLTDLQNLRQQFAVYPKMWREIKNLLPRIASTGDAGRQLSELLTRHNNHLQNLTKEFNTFDQSLGRDTLRLNMVTGRIQDEVRRTRMIPFQTIEALLQRTVRDAARSDSKEVILNITGGDVELDKKVLEMLKDPLLHLLRNAVGHGIETPEVRLSRSKHAEGQINLAVVQRGGEVRISVSDDGRGFDLDGLKLAASANNGHGDMAVEDAIALAFLPGVTTADRVTPLSGRGVGLDVVRQRLESLQGRISVDSTPGAGSTIRLIVPVSLAMARVLLVRIGKERYALPLNAVEKITPPTNTFNAEGRAMMTVNGTPLPLVSLAAALERPQPLESQRPIAVIMGAAQQRLALLVDEIITEQELAIKPLGKPLLRVRNITGAAVLGNGEPVFVLNPNDLVKSVRTLRGHTISIETGKKTEVRPTESILVVDDSITTRTLEKNILEAAGYKVITATDGVEALQQLRKHAIALVVADVEMPNMDGITLTRFIRESNEFNALPLILVTSLESREDRENGMTAGANAYIVKRGFNQAELLSTIQQLLG